MALGEAFVNVRADLKPFARDLEKGIKAILRNAERQIKEANLGRELGADIKKAVGDGVEGGLADGSKRGRRKAEREALSLGQKIFATIGDFVDDGLSALPPQVKAALVGAIVAASPIAAAALTGALAAAVGAVGVALVAVVAAQSPRIQRVFADLGQTLLSDLLADAEPAFAPLEKAASRLLSIFHDLEPEVRKIFAEAARDVEPFVDAIESLAKVLVPAFNKALQNSRPIIDDLDTSLGILGDGAGDALKILTDDSEHTAQSLRDVAVAINTSVVASAFFIRALTELAYVMRILNPLWAIYSDKVAETSTKNAEATKTTIDLAAKQVDLEAAIHGVNSAAIAEKLAISAVISAMLGGLDASIRYEEAIDNLAESFKKGNTSLDVTKEKGRENLRLVEQAIAAAAKQRDDAVANAAVTGESLEEINAKYQHQIDKIVEATGKVGQQDKAFKDLIARVRGVPATVELQVKTPGLESAIALFASLRTGAYAAANAIKAANAARSGGAGLQTAKQYAAGDIVTSPTVGLIAEAGYDEAVIPDPAVMPGRAMELSNKFGLTDLIAQSLGPQVSVTYVYIGSQRLDERIDYRVAHSNQQQATAMTQGTRGF